MTAAARWYARARWELIKTRAWASMRTLNTQWSAAGTSARPGTCPRTGKAAMMGGVCSVRGRDAGLNSCAAVWLALPIGFVSSPTLDCYASAMSPLSWTGVDSTDGHTPDESEIVTRFTESTWTLLAVVPVDYSVTAVTVPQTRLLPPQRPSHAAPPVRIGSTPVWCCRLDT